MGLGPLIATVFSLTILYYCGEFMWWIDSFFYPESNEEIGSRKIASPDACEADAAFISGMIWADVGNEL
jgi:hypothetical protein